jgi:hypothetical protein
MADENKPVVKADPIQDAQTIAKIATEEAAVQLEAIKRELTSVQAENTLLKTELGRANELMESQLRGKLVADVKAISKLTNDELAHMTTPELQSFLNTARQMIPAKKPVTFNTDSTEDPAPNITLGSLF